MPIFDFQCNICKLTKNDQHLTKWDIPVFCKCGARMQKVPSRFLADVFPNGGLFLEHVSSEGKLFHSKGEMRRYAKEHDLELGAL